MGRSSATLHLRGAAPEAALALAIDAFRSTGARLVDGPGPRTGRLGVAGAGDWANLALPRDWTDAVVDRIAAGSGLPGLLLYVVDSDYWGGALFHAGAVLRRFDTSKRPPGARTLRRQIAEVLGIGIAEARLAQVLAAQPTYAEEALAAFARLLAPELILDVPDGSMSAWIERAPDPWETP